ncbi:uncharacterized protein F5147DRAFT_45580 [Suillus discolor]|uniref:Uncharacterized protein n=1 Tax=Suillus discolor TaxID=1912936 RepID=A0A9P7JWX4_9AGAM|nr:uncharacterized protein F5147DRAFT_45580 [Suillus discolor]KAG2113425.1 hypothetical protein F5147DRAFT_45580 [Suillus discolor]
MPESTTPSHMSPHFALFDDCVESNATNNATDPEDTNSATDPEDEHTLTASGDLTLSPKERLGFVLNDIRRRNRLRLKARRRSAQYSPQDPAGKFWDPLTFSPISIPLTPTEYFDRYEHYCVRRAENFQRAQPEAAEAETRSRAAEESTFNHSSVSYDYGPEQFVSEVPEPGSPK